MQDCYGPCLGESRNTTPGAYTHGGESKQAFNLKHNNTKRENTADRVQWNYERCQRKVINKRVLLYLTKDIPMLIKQTWVAPAPYLGCLTGVSYVMGCIPSRNHILSMSSKNCVM